MSNMSYCRFENTLTDLRQCYYSVQEGEILSKSEAAAAKSMRKLAQMFIDEFDANYDESGVSHAAEDEEWDDDKDEKSCESCASRFLCDEEKMNDTETEEGE